LVEETGVPGENHRPVASHGQTLSHSMCVRGIDISTISRLDFLTVSTMCFFSPFYVFVHCGQLCDL